MAVLFRWRWRWPLAAAAAAALLIVRCSILSRLWSLSAPSFVVGADFLYDVEVIPVLVDILVQLGVVVSHHPRVPSSPSLAGRRGSVRELSRVGLPSCA
jgi:hypothetical protein